MERAMVFIDGNNFYHNVKKFLSDPLSVKTALSPNGFVKLADTICSKLNVEKKETIYYNSVPSIDIAGKEKYFKHLEFLSKLESLGIKVRKRKLQKRSTAEVLSQKLDLVKKLKLCENCRPQVTQNCIDCIGDIDEKEKGIDVMIAIEMVSKAMNGEYDVAVLVSGDADFVPALHLIKSIGKKIFVAFVSRGYSSKIKGDFPNEHLHIDDIVLDCVNE